jgi:hypothetical protein
MAILTDRSNFGATPATDDVLHLVDVSDSTDDPAGTSFKITVNDLLSFQDNRTAIFSNKTFTLPQINDISEDHQYIFGVSELVADRTITLPLLTGNDTFVFEAHAQTLTNKTIDGNNNTLTVLAASQLSGVTPVLNGGTGQSTYTDGQLLIGNTTGNTLAKATLTAGEGIDVTNGSGSITIVGEDASDTNKGIASFTANDFDVASGDVSIDYTNGQKATTTQPGFLTELATDAETNTGTDTVRGITPSNLGQWPGTTNITTLGTISTGTWQGTVIDHERGGLETDVSSFSGLVFIDSGSTTQKTIGIADTNIVQINSADVTDDEYARFTASGLESRSVNEVKIDLSLDNVENTALSTWPGSSNITTLGTIATGTWEATDVGVAHGGTGRSTSTAYAVLCGGTTSTGAHQSIAGVGTSGQVLTSNGADALPTFQNATGGSSIWNDLTEDTDWDDNPPSTSTITMNSDQTGNIAVGDAIKFTLGGGASNPGTYYATVAAITSNLLTIDGAPLETDDGDLTALSYAKARDAVRQISFYLPETLSTGDDQGVPFTWQLPEAFFVRATGQLGTAPTGTNDVRFAVGIGAAGNDLLNSPVYIELGSTSEVDSGVNINTTNYNVAFGEKIYINIDQIGDTIPGTGLLVNFLVVFA